MKRGTDWFNDEKNAKRIELHKKIDKNTKILMLLSFGLASILSLIASGEINTLGISINFPLRYFEYISRIVLAFIIFILFPIWFINKDFVPFEDDITKTKKGVKK